jgi:hypothetical protein
MGAKAQVSRCGRLVTVVPAEVTQRRSEGTVGEAIGTFTSR